MLLFNEYVYIYKTVHIYLHLLVQNKQIFKKISLKSYLKILLKRT